MANNNIYPIQLLNDLHNWFPDVLYNPGRFRTVQDLLEYIRQGADVNPYTRGLQIYRGRQTPLSSTVNRQPTYTTPVRTTRVPVVQTPARTHATVNDMNNLTNLTNLLSTPVTTSVRTFPLETLFADDMGMNLMSQILTPAILQSFLGQTVQVAATAEELRNATTVLTAPRTLEDNCAICQDLMEETQQLRRINHCGHSFHKQCIDTWFGTNVHCPTCRHDIREVSTAPEPIPTTNTNTPPPVSDNHRRTNIRENNNNS